MKWNVFSYRKETNICLVKDAVLNLPIQKLRIIVHDELTWETENLSSLIAYTYVGQSLILTDAVRRCA